MRSPEGSSAITGVIAMLRMIIPMASIIAMIDGSAAAIGTADLRITDMVLITPMIVMNAMPIATVAEMSVTQDIGEPEIGLIPEPGTSSCGIMTIII
jgi:hypothetical protein